MFHVEQLVFEMKKENVNIENAPKKAGVYMFFNKESGVIYVGKAKNIKNRVSSYFTNKNNSAKTKLLVRSIDEVKFIVVEDEYQALLLENNLIKQYQPKYNIKLKDGKTYPSICITNEEFPRIIKTRNIQKTKGIYFGPYSSSYTINTILEYIKDNYQVRSCRLPLTEKTIAQYKFKECLDYHIKKCQAPCVQKQTREDYLKQIEEIKQIIRGDADKISKDILKQIKTFSEKQEYEKAYLLKKKYDNLEDFKSKSVVANSVLKQTDVFSYEETDKTSIVNITRVYNGAIIQSLTNEYQRGLDESKEDILSFAIVDLREKLNSLSSEIVIPFKIKEEIKGVKYTVPIKGDRKAILKISELNAKQYKVDLLKGRERNQRKQKSRIYLTEIKEKLKLSKLPERIESIDISNISGTNNVGVVVVYVDGKPFKKEYRKYTIKTIDGADDYGAIKEVVFRRYSNKELDKPDLIIVDGGKGHMESVRRTLVDELGIIDIEIVGLAKNDKHKTNEILYGTPPKVVGIKSTDMVFNFMTQIQEEVHRFAIEFHRNKRSKTQISSELENIKGIGKITQTKLLNHFKSVKRIKMASFDELSDVIGSVRASVVYGFFSPK